MRHAPPFSAAFGVYPAGAARYPRASGAARAVCQCGQRVERPGKQVSSLSRQAAGTAKDASRDLTGFLIYNLGTDGKWQLPALKDCADGSPDYGGGASLKLSFQAP